MSVVILLYLGISAVAVLCTVLPILYMRRAQLERMREIELHAPLLTEYVQCL